MNAMLNPGRNGQKRPCLNEQIVRLDKMLDGLADGLNEAVAAAVKSAVTIAVEQTVQAVLTEVFTNPDVLAKLAAVTPAKPVEPKMATIRERLTSAVRRVRSCVRSVCTWINAKCRTAGGKMRAVAGHGLNVAVASGVRLWLLRRFAWPIGTAFGIGAIVAVAAWFSGPTVASTMSGIGAFTSALALQVGFWFRGLVRSAE